MGFWRRLFNIEEPDDRPIETCSTCKGSGKYWTEAYEIRERYWNGQGFSGGGLGGSFKMRKLDCVTCRGRGWYPVSPQPQPRRYEEPPAEFHFDSRRGPHDDLPARRPPERPRYTEAYSPEPRYPSRPGSAYGGYPQGHWGNRGHGAQRVPGYGDQGALGYGGAPGYGGQGVPGYGNRAVPGYGQSAPGYRDAPPPPSPEDYPPPRRQGYGQPSYGQGYSGEPRYPRRPREPDDQDEY